MKKRTNKKILVVTHQLSRTGAPIVLLDMIRIYRKYGYDVDLITMVDGELREELERMDITVREQSSFIKQAQEFRKFAAKYGMVVANTLLTYEIIHVLKNTNVPVLWWLHEGKQYFEYYASVIPDFHKLSSNIHVCSVGHYVRDVLLELYEYETQILHFGIEDVPVKNLEKTEGIKFLTVGTYSKVKAQDVLVKAIRLIPEKYMKSVEFFFCGNQTDYDAEVYFPVKALSEEVENVRILPQLAHKDMLDWMERCDCLIVPSRIDPIPTVAVEMMMKENICLCTDVCGIVHYMEDGVNGFTVPPEDEVALANKIVYLIQNIKELKDVGKRGRRIYEQYFSKQIIEPQILQIVDFCMYPKDSDMKVLAQHILQIESRMIQGFQLSEIEIEQFKRCRNMVENYIREYYIVEDIAEEQLLYEFCG